MTATEPIPGANPMDPPAHSLAARLLRVAWMAVLLGLVIEALLVALAAGFGKLGGASPIIADLVQKVSWSTFVCVGIAVGTAAAKTRPAAMGVLGLMAAPAGFAVARTLHKAAQQGLKLPESPGSLPTPVTLAIIKAIQYGLFGAALGWVERRSLGSFVAHLLVGLGAGVLFGGLILYLATTGGSSPSAYALVARGINELLFPVGCATVVYAAQAVGRHSLH